MRRFVFFSVALWSLFGWALAGFAESQQQSPAASDAGWMPLFNGKNLDGWYVFLRGQKKNEDPQKVFQVHDGVIHVYRDHADGDPAPVGYLATEVEYANYHLRLDFKWGAKKFKPRVEARRDCGLLYHLVAPDTVWPRSVECQIQEGDVGDCFTVRGTFLTTTVEPGREKLPFQFKTEANGGVTKTVGGPATTRVIKASTHERDGWNTVEVIVRGSEGSEHIVNGHTVFEAKDLKKLSPDNQGTQPLTHGPIALQAEFAEVFYRNIEIRPIADGPLQAAAPFHIQAHRGAGIARPENTLESFRWSWDRQVTPEADLRTTKDGVIVCFHDGNLKRVVKNPDDKVASAGIELLDLVQAQKLDVGSFRGQQFSGERVPALASVFEEMRGRPERLLYLDVKSVDLDAMAELVRQHDVARQVIFTSEHHRLIRDWKKRVPESLTLLWNGGTELRLTEKIEAVRKTGFDGITHLQVHVRVGDLESDEPFVPSRAFLTSLGDELAARGIVFQVLPWECPDQRAYEKLLALGVDSFATDYPEVTLKAVASFRKKEQASAR